MRTIVVLILSGAISLSWANTAKTSAPLLTDSSRPMVLTQAGELHIRLQSNRTTGFRWFFNPALSSPWIKPVSAVFQPPPQGLIGGSGVVVWTFKVGRMAFIVPQVGAVDLVYARPWDLAQHTNKHFDVVLSP